MNGVPVWKVLLGCLEVGMESKRQNISCKGGLGDLNGEVGVGWWGEMVVEVVLTQHSLEDGKDLNNRAPPLPPIPPHPHPFVQDATTSLLRPLTN